MTFHPPPADDAGQSDDLNAFLDAIARGEPLAPDALDPMLARDVRQIHGLAADSVAESTRRAGKAHRWEQLMQSQQIRMSTPHVISNVTLPPSSPAWPVPRVAVSPRRSRWHSRPMGIFATILLVALIALSGTAVYLTAPRNGGDGPTQLPATTDNGQAAFGTPQGTPVVPPADRQWVRVDGCYLQPTDFDGVMTSLRRPSNGSMPVYPDTFDLQAAIRGTNGLVPAPLLPRGNPVTQEDIDAVTTQFGTLLSCTNPLQAAQLFTPDGLYRYYTTGGMLGADRSTVAARFQDLWNANQHWESPTASNPSLSVAQGQWYIYGFRWIDSDRVAAYVNVNSQRESQTSFNAEKPFGFVVFVRDQGGNWKVDEFVAPPREQP